MTEEALTPDELEYIQLWSKALAKLSATDCGILSAASGFGAALSIDSLRKLVAENEKVTEAKSKLKDLLDEHRELTSEARLMAQNQRGSLVEHGPSSTPELRHAERVSDLVTSLLTTLNRDIAKQPDLKQIMYDLIDRGV